MVILIIGLIVVAVLITLKLVNSRKADADDDNEYNGSHEEQTYATTPAALPAVGQNAAHPVGLKPILKSSRSAMQSEIPAPFNENTVGQLSSKQAKHMITLA